MIMRRLFVSQPTRGKTQDEIIEARDKAIERLSRKLNEGFEVAESYFTEDEPKDVKNSGVYWLGKSLELLSECDLVLFIGDWYNYRGCQIEHQVCENYGIEIREDRGE
jgi:hypothetical protein|nr:MAG TPA: Nucleoside deoxyribosyltransferase [Caudoviricetes sp.]